MCHLAPVLTRENGWVYLLRSSSFWATAPGWHPAAAWSGCHVGKCSNLVLSLTTHICGEVKFLYWAVQIQQQLQSKKTKITTATTMTTSTTTTKRTTAASADDQQKYLNGWKIEEFITALPKLTSWSTFVHIESHFVEQWLPFRWLFAEIHFCSNVFGGRPKFESQLSMHIFFTWAAHWSSGHKGC